MLFANFAEAMAEGRGKAQADTLRNARKDILAKKLLSGSGPDARTQPVSAATLRKGDVVLVVSRRHDPGRRRSDRRRRLGR